MATGTARPNERPGWLGALQHASSQPAQTHGLWAWLANRLDPGEARPRQAEGIEERGFVSPRGASFVLKNPRAETYVRLTPREHFIWRRLDGRSVRQLLADYLTEYGSLAPGQLADLLARLRAAAMLHDPPRQLYADLTARLAPPTWSQRPSVL